MSEPTAKYTNCEDLFAALSQYLDAELPPGDCAALEKHIAGCPPCVEFLNSLKKTVELCGSPKILAAPPPLPDDVRSRLLEIYRQSLAARK